MTIVITHRLKSRMISQDTGVHTNMLDVEVEVLF